MDRPDRYGLVSRLLHWTMAYLLIWQFLVIVTWRLFGDRDWVTTVTSLGPGHGTVGLLVIGLVVIRATWALVNRKRRPVQSQSVSGRAAVAVHVSFYVLCLPFLDWLCCGPMAAARAGNRGSRQAGWRCLG
ncbi:cytochrome b [Agrobacterium rosae]